MEHDAKLFYLPQEPPPRVAFATAEQLMAAPVVGVPVVVPVQTARDLLRCTRSAGRAGGCPCGGRRLCPRDMPFPLPPAPSS